ncbi:MAG: hypothetical protein QXK37_01455 [Candidatus Woesearchaeota archaeon]
MPAVINIVVCAFSIRPHHSPFNSYFDDEILFAKKEKAPRIFWLQHPSSYCPFCLDMFSAIFFWLLSLCYLYHCSIRCSIK